jgi:hypothetical protein
MAIQPLNQQTVPGVRDIFSGFADAAKSTKNVQEPETTKAKQDTFVKSVNTNNTYIQEVQNQVNKTNTVTTEKTETPKVTVKEAQKTTIGLFNPKEVTNQKNFTNEMATQTKEMPKVKSNETIGT